MSEQKISIFRKTSCHQWRIQDFPLGGAPTHWGGADLQYVHFSAKTYAKTKEIDPVGGRAPAAPPGSANGHLASIASSVFISDAKFVCILLPT